MARLVIQDAHGRSSIFELTVNELIVGRSADAGLVLEDGRASRRHACITRDAGVFAIRDLNSGNGLYVNGKRVSEKVLAHADVIQVGHARLVFDDSAGSSAVTFAEHDSDPAAMLVRRIEDAASPATAPPGNPDMSAAEKELEVLHRKARILTFMYELGKDLKGAVSLEAVYGRVCVLLLEVCAADRVLILEIDETGTGLKVAYEGGGSSDAVSRTVSRTVTSKVIGERVTLLSTNASSDPALAQGQSIVRQQIRSVICAPLIVREQVQGVIYLDQDKVGAFSTEDLDAVNAVAAQAAIALENVHALKRQAREVEVRTAYSRFLPAHVVEELLNNPDKLTLGGANQVATVLFADVRGFTRMSALMDPEEIVGILNDYFGEMTEIIFQHGGTLDKYIGDGLMAVFGAPYSGPDDAIKAVRTAVAMQARMQALKGQFGSGKKGGVALGIGIGINTGIVTVGYVGSMRRFDYTAIGDTVNMAARLESNAPAGEIYIAGNTFSELRGLFPCVDLEVTVKGRDEPLNCHRVLWRQFAGAGEATAL
jgi:adenylate cyclase